MTATVDLGGTARLWDQDFNLLATEACATPHGELRVTVKGQGALYDAVKAAMSSGQTLRLLTLHLTFDPGELPGSFSSRRGGIVTSLSIEERPCECGHTITETTISAAA